MKLAGSKTDDVEWLIPLWSHEEPSQVKVNSPSSNRSLKFLTVCYLFLLICTSLLTWKAIILVLNLTPQPLPSAAQPVKKQVVLPATSFFDVPEVSQLVFNRNLSQTDSCWEVSSRFDCHPLDGASQERCEERGCCWREPDKQGPTNVNSSNNGLGSAKFGHLGVPLCFYPIGMFSQVQKRRLLSKLCRSAIDRLLNLLEV
jgi:Trefoil (P-type) domain